MFPTVGRIVHYYKGDTDVWTSSADFCPAIITRVWSATCVNLSVVRDMDGPVSVTSVEMDPNSTPRAIAEFGERAPMPRSWRWPPRE